MVAIMLDGLGSAVCHASTVKEELQRDRLLAHKIGTPPIVANLNLYFRREAEGSHHVSRLLALIRSLLVLVRMRETLSKRREYVVYP